MSRAESAAAFITGSGWGDAEIRPLAGDASNRRYDRLFKPSGETAVFMDAPPAKGEDVRPFVSIARHLSACGLSAPEILFEDSKSGFLLIEDLGDRIFAREMSARPELEWPLYEAAIDVLTHLHRHRPPALLRYDAETTVSLAALAYDWYQLGATGQTDDAQKALFRDALHAILAPFDNGLSVLIQRDYHAENLLWLPDRDGVARVGLLDFQDAMIGHPVYDLVSILQDARRDVSAKIEQQMMERFMAHSTLAPREFAIAYSVFGAQRSLRILGVFSRLCMRDGKAHYVDLIPRVWQHLKRNLAHPVLAPVADLINDHLPVPSPQVLGRIKDACGTCSSR